MDENKRDYLKEMDELLQKMYRLADEALEEEKIVYKKEFKKMISRLIIEKLIQRSTTNDIDSMLKEIKTVFDGGVEMFDNEIKDLGMWEEEAIMKTKNVMSEVIDGSLQEIKEQLLRIYANG